MCWSSHRRATLGWFYAIKQIVSVPGNGGHWPGQVGCSQTQYLHLKSQNSRTGGGNLLWKCWESSLCGPGVCPPALFKVCTGTGIIGKTEAWGPWLEVPEVERTMVEWSVIPSLLMGLLCRLIGVQGLSGGWVTYLWRPRCPGLCVASGLSLWCTSQHNMESTSKSLGLFFNHIREINWGISLWFHVNRSPSFPCASSFSSTLPPFFKKYFFLFSGH
jgi:hypothetical protein